MKKMKRSLIFALLCLYMVVIFCGCADAAEPDDSTDASKMTQTQPVTEAPTEPQPVYEKQTVYLCTYQKMTLYENGAVLKTAYAYDEYGRKIEQWREAEDGSRSQVSTFLYDEFGNNVEERYEQSSRYAMTYNDAGNLISKLCYYGDECKDESYFTYNEDGHLIEEMRITRYSQETTSTYQFSYNEDYTEAVIDVYENGEKIAYIQETYNSRGQVLVHNIYDLDGNWWSGSKFEYNEDGKITVEWCYSGSEIQADYQIIYTYDENGLLVSQNVDYYYGHLVEYTYEPFEILVEVN